VCPSFLCYKSLYSEYDLKLLLFFFLVPVTANSFHGLQYHIHIREVEMHFDISMSLISYPPYIQKSLHKQSPCCFKPSLLRARTHYQILKLLAMLNSVTVISDTIVHCNASIMLFILLRSFNFIYSSFFLI
jgi:hypothetical protein